MTPVLDLSLALMSPNSSSKFPQSTLGIAVSSVAKNEGGPNAKESSDQNESGDNTLTPISRTEVTCQKSSYNFSRGEERRGVIE